MTNAMMVLHTVLNQRDRDMLAQAAVEATLLGLKFAPRSAERERCTLLEVTLRELAHRGYDEGEGR